MFGHSNDTMQNGGGALAEPTADGMLSHQPNTATPSPATIAPSSPMPSSTISDDSVGDYVMTALPGTAAPQNVAPTSVPTATPSAPTDTTSPTPPVVDDPDGLLELKQTALQELSPLVSHLDQSPEEKFRTTMMMIQASDDHTMLKAALEAAKQITDEKARAQALLDVVNEINYFTQHTEA